MHVITHEQVAGIVETILDRVQTLETHAKPNVLNFANLEWDEHPTVDYISCRTPKTNDLTHIRKTLALFNLRVELDTDCDDEFTYFLVRFPKVKTQGGHNW